MFFNSTPRSANSLFTPDFLSKFRKRLQLKRTWRKNHCQSGKLQHSKNHRETSVRVTLRGVKFSSVSIAFV